MSWEKHSAYYGLDTIPFVYYTGSIAPDVGIVFGQMTTDPSEKWRQVNPGKWSANEYGNAMRDVVLVNHGPSDLYWAYTQTEAQFNYFNERGYLKVSSSISLPNENARLCVFNVSGSEAEAGRFTLDCRLSRAPNEGDSSRPASGRSISFDSDKITMDSTYFTMDQTYFF